ncbi:alpha-L-rhamnosidase-like protein [Gibbsiella quercinecans]|nr:sugar hydrolase [Gibbsiella quercinecans]TCT83003.1 alpha-L-rhamnosidase-like protein [Gibbsiella quercinecans]
MNRRELLIKAAVVAGCVKALPAAQAASAVSATSGTPANNKPAPLTRQQHWLEMAEILKPSLKETPYPAIDVVVPREDKTNLLGVVMDNQYGIAELPGKSFKNGESFIIDFGEHYTGYLTFTLGWKGVSCDAPVRLRLIFGEVSTDVAQPLYPYKGWISASWLPDEVLNVDFLPQQVRIVRRHAFRYVKIEVISTSSNFSATFSDLQVQAVSSAGADRLRPANYPSPMLRDIDRVSIRTLHECMQTCFEDGPKRDRRLWVGDLRLQALVNYVSFNNAALVRRCLYLFAGLQREDGYITACVYEKPQPRIGEVVLIDYAALFGSIVLDYLHATKDTQTAAELWPVAKQQLELALKNVNAQGLFVAPEKDYVFIDWNPGQDQSEALKGLDKQAAMQGLLIYSCQQGLVLAREVGRQQEAVDIENKVALMKQAAVRQFFDQSQGVFVSGEKRQVSWASQAWMALANVLPREQMAQALQRVMAMPQAVRPMTPYLYHHMVDALIRCGLKLQAQSLVETYWGAMVSTGTNTFWEAFDPQNPLSSPYGSKQIDSYCHAWSCTPSYFIRNGFAQRE